jgi:ribonuclease Z
VCEANFASDKEKRAEKAKHLTAAQAAQIAAGAEAKCLMLNHVSREYADDLGKFLSEATAIFPHTLLPKDLEVFQVTQNGVHCVNRQTQT